MAKPQLAEDVVGRPIQALAIGPAQDVSFTNTGSTQGTALTKDCCAVRLLATVDCRVAIGPAATAGATGCRVAAGIPEVFRVPPGTSNVVAARGADTSGILNITELN